MAPSHALFPSPPRRQLGRLRWPLAWLLALALTAGMLLLLAGVVPGRKLVQLTPPEALSASLHAPRRALPSEAPKSVNHAAAPSPTRHTEAPPPPLPHAPQILSAEPLAQPQPAITQKPAPAIAAPAENSASATPPAAAAGTGSARAHPENAAQTTAAQLSKLPLAQRCPQQVKPVFPAIAHEDSIEHGRVRVRLLLAADGKVRSVEILEASPAGYFEAATRRAAQQWQCLPSSEAGDSVIAPFVFQLN